jgi:hypothetical protein
VLERGRLVEKGTDAELMEHGIVYPRLVGTTPGSERARAPRDGDRPDGAVDREPSAIAI